MDLVAIHSVASVQYTGSVALPAVPHVSHLFNKRRHKVLISPKSAISRQMSSLGLKVSTLAVAEYLPVLN